MLGPTYRNFLFSRRVLRICVSSKSLGDVNISTSCPGNHTLKFKGNGGIKFAQIVQKKIKPDLDTDILK